MGVAMKRKEDPRFLQGKGNYVDDLSFPGMLRHGDPRSPYPHAEIVNIDSSAPRSRCRVKAVITGKDLEAAGLGWLPTFHGYDKQMVLAIGKALFQDQEVAAVFAESRAAALTAPRRWRWSTSRCRSSPTLRCEARRGAAPPRS